MIDNNVDYKKISSFDTRDRTEKEITVVRIIVRFVQLRKKKERLIVYGKKNAFYYTSAKSFSLTISILIKMEVMIFSLFLSVNAI